MKRNLFLVEIDPKYCRFLWQFDNRVMDSFSPNKTTRKYLGVLFMINNNEYFAPLSSKPSHLNLEEKIDYIKKHKTDPSLFLVYINTKNSTNLVAQVNLNNMIPVQPELYNKISFTKLRLTNPKSADFLSNELRYLNENKIKIIKNAEKLYKSKINKTLNPKLDKVTCDFKLLESKSTEYLLPV